jgi:two-component system sensor histidine kinase/response regulator
MPAETPSEEHLSTILVVDDNDANRALAQGALEDEGYRVLLASGGGSALELFSTEKPDCVLLDVRMPDVDGLTACRRIRELPGGDETPIVFLTALRDVETFDQAVAAGGDDFLTKPVNPAELVVRVRAALKLRQMRAELREHYELLRHQRDTLMRVQLQKERLSAFVVHDLKNPVSAMDLHAQLLLREAGLSAHGLESVRTIRKEAQQLTRMLLNLLDLAKGDEGKLVTNLSTVRADGLVTGVLDELSVTADARSVSLEADVQIQDVRLDPELFRRVLVNLAENAIRHAPKRTTVTVSALAARDSVEFRVRDTGAGIPVNQRARIFDPFVRLEHERDSNPVSRGGRGLGLAFCKIAIEAHGGAIRVEDGDPGAVFIVTLPAA